MAAGVLVRDGDGRLQAGGSQLATDHEIYIEIVNRAADQLHRRILSHAPEMLALPNTERQFGALTFAVPASAVPALKARITRFYEETMHLVETTSGPCDRVYQLCVQLYPVASTPVGYDDDRRE
jgi:uncharacterized protein (TIGR02147 family)